MSVPAGLAPGLRAARLDDAHAIAAVHLVSWQAGYVGVLPENFLASLSLDKWTINWRTRLADTQTRHIFVSEHKGLLTGFAACGASRDSQAEAADWELHMLYVAPAYWRQGIGHKLCQQAITLGQRANCSSMSLWVLADNFAARAFYESTGMVADGQEKVDESLCGIPLHELRYQRELA